MRNLHKLQKGGHILRLMDVAFEKIGLVEHVKLASKWKHHIIQRTS
jgi:hypothetical protein